MSWLFFALAAYVIFAAVSLGDKYFLTGPTPDPKLYAFYVGLLGLSIALLVPVFGLPRPAPFFLGVALGAGTLFVVAQYFLFLGLHRFEASRIIPAVGGLTPIFTLLAGSAIFPGASLAPLQFAAFAFLLAGSVLLTWQDARKVLSESLMIAVLTSLFFGVSFAISKLVYTGQSFWSGFFWMRMGGGGPALAFLLFPRVRAELRTALSGRRRSPKARGRLTGLFFLNQAGGAAAAVFQNISLSLVPVAFVAFVNALQGVEYLTLLVFGAAWTKLRPRAKLHEYISGTSLAQKFLGIVCISLGLVLISFSG